MADDFPIEREDAPGHGRYVIHLPGGLEAEMTFRKIGTDVIAIDHTYTPPEFRGQNIAARLMERDHRRRPPRRRQDPARMQLCGGAVPPPQGLGGPARLTQ